MKTSYIMPFLMILTSFVGSAQRPIKVNLTYVRPTFDKIDSIELANNGVRIYVPYSISVSKNYFPNADKFDLSEPLVFIRDTATLRTRVTYFFSQPGNIIRLVEYSWNRDDRDRNEIQRIYNSNDSAISKQLGKQGIETKKRESTWSQLTKTWITDSIHIKQFMLIEGDPSRTRVLISWN